MAENINITFNSQWKNASSWSGTLEFKMVNSLKKKSAFTRPPLAKICPH